MLDRKSILEDVKNLIDQSNTSFSLHDEEEDYIIFETRENGDVGSEEHSDIDVRDALKIKNLILEKYSNELEADIETVDEFVMLTFKFK